MLKTTSYKFSPITPKSDSNALMSIRPPSYSPVDPSSANRLRRPLPKPLFIRPPTPWDAGSGTLSTPSSPATDDSPDLIPTPFDAPSIHVYHRTPRANMLHGNRGLLDNELTRSLKIFADDLTHLKSSFEEHRRSCMSVQGSVRDLCIRHDE